MSKAVNHLGIAYRDKARIEGNENPALDCKGHLFTLLYIIKKVNIKKEDIASSLANVKVKSFGDNETDHASARKLLEAILESEYSFDEGFNVLTIPNVKGFTFAPGKASTITIECSDKNTKSYSGSVGEFVSDGGAKHEGHDAAAIHHVEDEDSAAAPPAYSPHDEMEEVKLSGDKDADATE